MPRKKQSSQDPWEQESDDPTGLTLEELIDMKPCSQVSDSDGNSNSVGCNVHPMMMRKIIRIQEKRGTPYESRSDILRDCVFIGLEVINMRMKGDNEWHTFAEMSRTADSLAEISRLKAQIKQMEQNLDMLMRDGDIAEAVAHFESYVNSITGLNEGFSRKKLFKYMTSSRTMMDVLKHCRPAIQHVLKSEGGIES